MFLLFAVMQWNWMAERQNYKDAFLRMGAAPTASLVLCAAYFFFFKVFLRALSIDFSAFLSKTLSFFPLLYANVFLVFFPQVTENALFFELVLFLIVHFFVLAQLKPFSSVEKLSTFFMFLLLSLVFCELSLRGYHRVRPSFIFASTSYDRFRALPHSTHFDFKLNSGGFSDVEFKTQKAAGKTRIIGLGDSFLFGNVPYSYNFITLLENNLAASGNKVELYNMGIPGMSIDDYYNLLVHEALPLKPDVVICHVYVQNDFKNYYASFSYSSNNLFHYDEWHMFKLMDYAFRIKPKFKRRIIRGKAAYNDNAPTMDRETYLNMQWGRYEIFDAKIDIQSWYKSSAEILLKMKNLLEKAHASFFVVLIPDEIQIDTDLQKEFLKFVQYNNLSKEAGHELVFDFDLPQKQIKKYLRKNHIAFVDLLPVFKEEAKKGTRLYIPNDFHWNIAGNRLAAEELYKSFSRINAKVP